MTTPTTAEKVAEARITRDQHDPSKQDHGYDRCEHCHYTSHPCDVYDLASWVIEMGEQLATIRQEDDR